MRHSVYGKQLGRTKNERQGLFKNLVRSLILYGSIQTTQAKASAIKGLVDKVINLSKQESSKQLVSGYITEKAVFEKLTKEILPKLSDRTSGYTSVVKLGKRLGDGAMMVQLSLLTTDKQTKSEKLKAKSLGKKKEDKNQKGTNKFTV